LIEEKTLKGKQYNYTIATVCIDGYKFVISRNPNTRSMVQFYEQVRGRGPGIGLQPAKC
jgi:hypothetical protein